jgi:hypothetical protein
MEVVNNMTPTRFFAAHFLPSSVVSLSAGRYSNA